MAGRSKIRAVAATPDIVVIGAGLGGLTAGMKLLAAGITTFTVYEKAFDIGGTWLVNDYPGAEVDVHSRVYSWALKKYDWSRTHAGQAELKAYIDEVVDEAGLRSHITNGLGVVAAVWNESSHRYDIELDDGTRINADVVISAVGLLNIPQYPHWPGLDGFNGPAFHTSRWEHEHDLTGQTVAVVGTGSSSAQVVPALADRVEKLYVYQREPGWIIPKGDRNYTAEERAAYRSQGELRRKLMRWKQFALMQFGMVGGQGYRPGTPFNRYAEKICRDYIAKEFADRPDLRDAVTPRYPFPGKRPVTSQDYYPALKKPTVELVPHAVESVTPDGIVSADGVERRVDALVMATGFQPANFIASVRIVGRGGLTLQQKWCGEPQAFLGLQVSDFPNFYMFYGPNTNGGEIFVNFAAQAQFVIRNINRMMSEGVTSIEVSARAERRYNEWLQRKMAGTAWVKSNNYYKSESGRVVTQWPYDAVSYSLLTRLLQRRAQLVRTLTSPSGAGKRLQVDTESDCAPA